MSYLVLARVLYDEPKQVVLNGKAYNIFVSQGRALIRIVREDGTVVFSLPEIVQKGQGANADQAIQATLREVRKAVEEEIGKTISIIKEKLD